MQVLEILLRGAVGSIICRKVVLQDLLQCRTVVYVDARTDGSIGKSQERALDIPSVANPPAVLISLHTDIKFRRMFAVLDRNSLAEVLSIYHASSIE